MMNKTKIASTLFAATAVAMFSTLTAFAAEPMVDTSLSRTAAIPSSMVKIAKGMGQQMLKQAGMQKLTLPTDSNGEAYYTLDNGETIHLSFVEQGGSVPGDVELSIVKK